MQSGRNGVAIAQKAGERLQKKFNQNDRMYLWTVFQEK